MGDNAWSRIRERHSIDKQAVILSELISASVLNSTNASAAASREL